MLEVMPSTPRPAYDPFGLAGFDFFSFLRRGVLTSSAHTKHGMKMRSNTKKATKACKVMDAPRGMKVCKAKTVFRLPKGKAAKVNMEMEKTQKRKSSDLLRVVNFPHLGLGLRIGHYHTKSHLQQLCKGDAYKLKRLETMMKDPTILHPQHNASVIDKDPCESIPNGKKTNKVKTKSVLQKAMGKAAFKLIQKSRSDLKQKKTAKNNTSRVDQDPCESICNGKKTNKVKTKSVLQKSQGTAASKIQKSRSNLRQKKTITKSKREPKSKKNAMIKVHNPKGTRACKRASMRSLATRVQHPSSKKKMPAADEATSVGHRRKTLIALTLAALEKLYKKHKKNSLGTEPVNDTLAKTKEDLISKQLLELKDMCSKNHLAVSGTKRVLVKRLIGREKEMLKAKLVRAILIFEGIAHSKARKREAKEQADSRRNSRRQKEKVYNATCKLKKDIGAKTDDELKDILRRYGLKVSGTKDEKIERVVARQQEEGGVGRILSEKAAWARRQELLRMSPDSLMAECKRSEDVLQDGLLKQVMLDRLLLNEVNKWNKCGITCT